VSGKYGRSRGGSLVHTLGTGSGVVSLTLACVLSGQRADGSLDNTPGPSIFATDLRKSVTIIIRPMVYSCQSLTLASAVELIEQNLDANQRTWEGVDAKAGVLDWDNRDLPNEVVDAPPAVLVYVSTPHIWFGC
jgi:hypothetical protein